MSLLLACAHCDAGKGSGMAIRDALVVTTIATGEQWFVHRPSVKGECFREVVGPASVHAIAMASDRISDLSATVAVR